MRSRLALALAALCLAPAANADWKNDYDRGVREAAAGNWAEVDAAMRSAIAQEAKPSERKRFQGVVHKVYVPHYYAGLAAYRRGDCATAMEFWSHRASKEVVALIGELNSVQNKGIADCNAKLAAATTTPPTTTATTTPSTTTPSTTSAAKPPMTSPPVATTTSPAKPPVTTPAKPPQTAPAKPPAPVVGPAPAALVQGVENWLRGRYAAVAQTDPNTLGDARAKAQGFLLRAAARHVQAELAGGDTKLLDQARADVRAARAANAALAPDDTLFSPRFRAFWTATR